MPDRPSQHVFKVHVDMRGRLTLLCDCEYREYLNTDINGYLPLSEIDKYVVRHHHAVLDGP